MLPRVDCSLLLSATITVYQQPVERNRDMSNSENATPDFDDSLPDVSFITMGKIADEIVKFMKMERSPIPSEVDVHNLASTIYRNVTGQMDQNVIDVIAEKTSFPLGTMPKGVYRASHSKNLAEMKKIHAAATVLLEFTDRYIQVSDVDRQLEANYLQVLAGIAGDDASKQPSRNWHLLLLGLTNELKLFSATTGKTYEELAAKSPTRGQPAKADRDAIFFNLHDELMETLGLPEPRATHLAVALFAHLMPGYLVHDTARHLVAKRKGI